jgi:hypothetical protein
MALRFAKAGLNAYVKVADYLQEGEEPLDHGLAREERLERLLGAGQGEGLLITTDRRIIYAQDTSRAPFSISYATIKGWNIQKKLLVARLHLDTDGGSYTFTGGKVFFYSVGKTIDALQTREPPELEATEVRFSAGANGVVSGPFGARIVCLSCQYENGRPYSHCVACMRTIDWAGSMKPVLDAWNAAVEAARQRAD